MDHVKLMFDGIETDNKKSVYGTAHSKIIINFYDYY